MSESFSIVVICKNEVSALNETLPKLMSLCNDILVYDTGSTDGTQLLVKNFGIRLIEGPWEGFGATKNKANNLAKNDWILSLDADEIPDETLAKKLREWSPPKNRNTVYSFSFVNYLGHKPVRFGEWGWDKHIRMFNRKLVKWNEAIVHEKLNLPYDTIVQKIKGNILHKTVRDLDEYNTKVFRYASLSADKYFLNKRKASWVKRFLSPVYTFIHYYFLKLGFLDGCAGVACAYMTAKYTYLKYQKLHVLWQHNVK